MLPVQQRALNLYTVPKWRNWQTRVVQVHVLARVWGFESLLRHQSFKISSLERFYGSFYILQPLTGRRWLSLALVGKWPSRTTKLPSKSIEGARDGERQSKSVSIHQGRW